MSKTKVIWTIREFTSVLRRRQLNQFDCNIGVSGKRGDGKSTLLFKIFNSFVKDGFVPSKHQVYAQDDVIRLLGTERFGFCWDDEAINSGYKRDFQNSGQKKLIKVVTNYRDSFNIYGSALPFFYNLDKDLRELIFAHIHIIERGVGVLLLPLTDQVHSSDPWDTKSNIKIETQEYTRMKKDPKNTFRYHRFTTFAGYIYFGDMTKKQRNAYLKIKAEKRAKTFGISNEESNEQLSFFQKAYKLLLDGKLTQKGLMQASLLEGKKYSVVSSKLNQMLKDDANPKTLKKMFLNDNVNPIEEKAKEGIDSLVPSL